MNWLLDEFIQRSLDFLMFPVAVCLTCTVMEISLLLFAVNWFYLMSAVQAAFVAAAVEVRVMDASAPAGQVPRDNL